MLDLTTKKKENQVRNIIVVNVDVARKAVVKNQLRIIYLKPKREVLTLSIALVNATDELLSVISIALAANSALLKFSTKGTTICYLGSQLQM